MFLNAQSRCRCARCATASAYTTHGRRSPRPQHTARTLSLSACAKLNQSNERASWQQGQLAHERVFICFRLSLLFQEKISCGVLDKQAPRRRQLTKAEPQQALQRSHCCCNRHSRLVQTVGRVRKCFRAQKSIALLPRGNGRLIKLLPKSQRKLHTENLNKRAFKSDFSRFALRCVVCCTLSELADHWRTKNGDGRSSLFGC